MKKKHKIIFGAAILVVLLVGTVLWGVLGNQMYQIAKTHLSEIRYNLYAGQTSLGEVTFMSGQRESEYIINGENTPLTDFGLLTFVPAGSSDVQQARYHMVADEQVFEGNFEKNPFDQSWVADVETILENVENFTVQLTLDTEQVEATLSSVTAAWTVNHEKAIEIGCSALNLELKAWMKNGTFPAEGYVKIIHDATLNNTDYYWYVNFVNQNGEHVAVIIDPVSKEILAKKS